MKKKMKFVSKQICTKYQLSDIMTKTLGKTDIKNACSKFGNHTHIRINLSR